ncbi:unnamed protein product [Caenorhabditis brenneri]
MESPRWLLGRVFFIMNFQIKQKIFQGWNIFDLPTNKELAKFFSSRNHDQLQEFEEKVFMNGHDPKTYIRIQMMKESKATVELSKEILEKKTEFYPVINCGGVEGYYDGQASSSSGFRNGRHPTMDNPEMEHQICEEYYRQMLRNEMKQLEKLNKIKAHHDLMRK